MRYINIMMVTAGLCSVGQELILRKLVIVTR